jgi:hypothetical protein
VVEFSCVKALEQFGAATRPSRNKRSSEIVRRSKNEVAWINSACEETGLVRNMELALKYAMEAAKNGDPYSVDSLAAVRARLGDFRAAISYQQNAIRGLEIVAQTEPVEAYTFAEFRARLKAYQDHQPARFGPWNAEQNCNTLPKD